MDRHIAAYVAESDDDLMLTTAGIAYQADMTARVEYGDGYLAKIAGYDATIAATVNRGRCALLARHAASGATVLDFGAGDGAFLREARSWGFDAKGFEVIRSAADALAAEGLYDDDPGMFDAVTAWDSIEHMDDPGRMLRRITRGALFCCSLPIFGDLRGIRHSKHYRPGEHLLYFTDEGFVDWMKRYGFRLLERSDHEVKAGRESIGAYAFCRDWKA